MKHSDTDVIIAGGGLAGATLALALARVAPALRVTVAETFPLSADALPESYQPSYDARSTALAWGSRLIFEELGLWSRLSEHATPIRQIHVSDRGHFGATRLNAKEYQQQALGYVVDNRWMGLCLMRELLSTDTQWRAPAEVVDMKSSEQGVNVTLKSGDEISRITAQCLIVADGGRSGLREKLGFQPSHHSYDQNALVANVSTSESHEFTAFERFTEAGPMAMLPQGSPSHASHQSALVWTLSDEELEAVLAMSDSNKCQRLQNRFGWRLGRFTKIGECNHYPLTLTTVDEPVRPGVALVGNAAHALHPVAGQGFNLALRGLMTLVEQFRLAAEQGRSPGDFQILRRYHELHRPDWQQTVKFSDSLIRIFGQTPAPVTAARDAGLVGLDLLPGAKRLFARNAMGIGGRRAVINHPGLNEQPDRHQHGISEHE
ncbi:2-octaprenyl-6-methoxyphenyl hydroxylase [Marinobacter sp. 1_MG-2023]|uniref:2-octaprenyl-6-methoxyphenyl hydroxylase n=1 Tax=Marinobacter sp. 1_MG-2023 TaxID=3062627 RepID=UPI0026E21A0C|nr:2-octaprenyl-6-methoxyphenyl hydroxylase [Marinobacter sp. 1_MG-2023]MDO6822508.1 2-octaprenyl-6-methoxyphenyl hydroxylase [Marinobacter sp. 1_MG-2023]